MKPVLLKLMLPALLASAGSSAWAQHAVLVPIEVEYIKNPGLTPEGEEEVEGGGSTGGAGNVTLSRISPQYSIESVADDRRSVVNLGAVVEHSSDTTQVASRTLPSVGLLWEVTAPTSVLGFQASLEEASTRSTEFVEFGRVALDSTQRTGSLGATWSKEMSPIRRLDLAAEYARVSYDSPLLEAYREASASASVQTAIGTDSNYFVQGSVARLTPDGDTASESRVGLLLGYETALTSALSLNAGLGAVRTSGSIVQRDPIGHLRLAYTGERATYALAWERTVGAGGTVGGYSRTQELDASMGYALTANSSMEFSARRVEALATEGVEGSAGSVGSSLLVRFRSEISQWWAMTLTVEGRHLKYADRRTATGHSVGIGFVYSHPDF